MAAHVEPVLQDLHGNVRQVPAEFSFLNLLPLTGLCFGLLT